MLMYDYYDFDTEVPDVEIDRIKEDFRTVFNRNAVDVELIKHYPQDVPEGADFYGTNTPSKVYRKRIRLFITASSSDAYSRKEHGIVTNEATFDFFAEPEVEIRNDDFIKFLRNTKILDFDIKRNQLFIVQNHNRPYYKGQFAWQQGNLKRVDKESPDVYGTSTS